MENEVREEQQPKRRMPASDRREGILEAARLAFSEAGYRDVSLKSIATRAGVSKALLYEHFDSKVELYEAILELHGSELLEAIETAVHTSESAEERVRAGIEAFLAFAEDRRGSWRIIFGVVPDAAVVRAQESLRDRIVSAIAAIVEEEVLLVRPDQPEHQQFAAMQAQQTLGAMRALSDWWDRNPGVPRELVLDAAMDFVWLGGERLSRGERWPESRQT